MFEEKRLSSSTLFKTIIFAGVLCLMIIYRGATHSPSDTQPEPSTANATVVNDTNNIPQVDISAQASQRTIEASRNPVFEETNQQATRQDGATIEGLITGSINADDNSTKNTARLGAGNAAPQTEANQISASSVTVKSGDTLYSISRKTGVSVAALTSANNIKSNLIRVGQVLTIPR